MLKKWEGISVYKRIANVNVGKKKIEDWQLFRTCLETMKSNPRNCLRRNCIIGLLINRLVQRGAKL